MKVKNFTLLIFLITLIFFPSKADALDSSRFPTDLKVEWQNGGNVNTPFPILTWNNPADTTKIDSVVVRIRKEQNMNTCSDVIEHWFLIGPESQTPCQSSSTTISTFKKDFPPISYSVPAAQSLQDNQTYYWTVFYHTQQNGWINADGYVQTGAGGGGSERHSFTTSFIQNTKNILGVNVYTNSQINTRGLTNNPQGIEQLLNTHLDWAKNAVGEGAYIKLFNYNIISSTQGADQNVKKLVQKTYERKMIPVVRLQADWTQLPRVADHPWDGHWNAPQETNGNYDESARAYARVVSDLPKNPNIPLLIEVYNEMNYTGIEWGKRSIDQTASEYPRFFIAAYNAIKQANPGVKVFTGGLGTCGDVDFLNKMLRTSGFGEKATADGIWPVHLYPNKYEPVEGPDGWQKPVTENCGPSTLLRYKLQLDSLSRSGVDVKRLKVLVTEAGYGFNNDNQPQIADRYVKMTEILAKDSTWIEGLSFFDLDEFADYSVINEPPNHDNPGLDWVYFDSNTDSLGLPTHPTAIYTKMAEYTSSRSTVSSSPPAGAAITLTGYSIAESAADLPTDSNSRRVIKTSNAQNINITHNFPDTAIKTTYTIFVRFFYSNGQTIDKQQSIIYSPPAAPSTTPTSAPSSAPTAAPTATPTPTPTPTPIPPTPAPTVVPNQAPVTLTGYAVANSPSNLPSSATTSITSIPVTISYNLPTSSTRTTQTVFVRFFYSNGQTIDKQQSIIYNPPPVATPVPTVAPASVSTQAPTPVPTPEIQPLIQPKIAIAGVPAASISGSKTFKVGQTMNITTNIVSPAGIQESIIWISKVKGTEAEALKAGDIEDFNESKFNCGSKRSFPNCIWYKIASSTTNNLGTNLKINQPGKYTLIMEVIPSSNPSTKRCSGNPYVSYPISTGGLTFYNCGPGSTLRSEVSP